MTRMNNVANTRRNQRTKRTTVGGSIILAAILLSSGGVGARPSVTLEQAGEIPGDASATSAASTAVGSVGGRNASVSGDGRFVVFEGAPVAEGSNDERLSTIYLADRETGESTELTPVPAGLRSGESSHPVISGDGCSVVTLTQMSLDVFRDDDTGERWDVYRSMLPHCGGEIADWELISTRAESDGLARDDVTLAAPAVSRGGTSIAYTHPADHLFESDGITTVTLVDVTVTIDDPNRSRFIAGSPADSPIDTFVHRGLDQPVLSGDGRYLAYRSDATSSEAVPGWAAGAVDGGPAVAQVFVWEVDQLDPFAAVHLVSAMADGSPAPTGASSPDISRNGMNVAFTSPAGLVDAVYPTCSVDCPSQVFVLDRDSDDDGAAGLADDAEMQLVSAQNDVEPLVAGSAPSDQPSISGDGQLVAFVTKSTNLQLIEVPGVGSGDDGDLLLSELRLGRLSRLTDVAGSVLPTQGVHAHPDLSESGRIVVFDSNAADALLVDGALPDARDGVGAGRQIVARSADPLLSLSAADLGTTLVEVQSDEWYVAVINDGPSSFRPTSVSITNPQFQINDEQSSCLLSSSVPAGGSCTIAISFTPNAPGPTSGTLTVAEEGFGAVAVSSEVAGAGGDPALRITPAGADLGVVTVGEPSTEFQFDLSNISFSPTEVTSYQIVGDQAADFELTSNNCAFRPVNPRASCSVGVTFTPSDEGRRTALVELATADGQYTTMVVAGDGEFAPVVEIDMAEVDAGNDFTAVGTKYPPNTEVVVVFGDGPNSSLTAVTDADGNFAVTVPVDTNERGGDRTIVVQSSSGATASAPVAVIEDNQVPVGLPGFGLG